MKLIIQILSTALVCYCLVAAVVYLIQEKMLFFPMGPVFGKCPGMDRFGAKAVHADRLRYYIKKSDSAKALFVVFHGNAGSACDRTYFFNLLSGMDADIALFEYPGYGGDPDKPGEKRMLSDALAVVQTLMADLDHSMPVFLVGESLGTGIATWVSTRTDISGLILISAYTAISDVAQNHYPWLPVKYLLKHQFKADLWAKQSRSPAILFHGRDDDIIPIDFARRQVLNFKKDARLFEIDHCGHNDIVNVGERKIQEEISRFVQAVSAQD